MNFNIKDIITGVTVNAGITLVTVYNLPYTTSAVQRIFTRLAKANVNVDMISLNPSQGFHQTISFSASDDLLSTILSVVGQFKATFAEIRTDANSQNCKITFEGEKMKDCCGVAAFVFEAFSDSGLDIKLITTSETKISILIDETQYGRVTEMLEKIFGIKEV